MINYLKNTIPFQKSLPHEMEQSRHHFVTMFCHLVLICIQFTIYLYIIDLSMIVFGAPEFVNYFPSETTINVTWSVPLEYEWPILYYNVHYRLRLVVLCSYLPLHQVLHGLYYMVCLTFDL